MTAATRFRTLTEMLLLDNVFLLLQMAVVFGMESLTAACIAYIASHGG